MFCDRLPVIVLLAGLSRAEFSSQEIIPGHSYHGKGGSFHPRVYCYTGRRVTYFGVFSDVHMKLIVPPVHYELYECANETVLDSEVRNSMSSCSPVMPTTSDIVQFKLSESKCIVLLTSSEYWLEFNSTMFEFYRLVLFLIGLKWFFLAEVYVRTTLFFYAIGYLVFILVTFLCTPFSLYMIISVIPAGLAKLLSLPMSRSPTGYIFGFWMDLYDVLDEYGYYVFLQVAYSPSLLVFFYCIFGPLSAEKHIYRMQLCTQILGLDCVRKSSDEMREVMLAFCLVLLLAYNIMPRELYTRMLLIAKDIFFPANKLFYLTELSVLKVQHRSEGELPQQRDEATRIEHEKLGEFAQSPECPVRTVVSELQTPQKFGRPLVGGNHLEDDEFIEALRVKFLLGRDADDMSEANVNLLFKFLRDEIEARRRSRQMCPQMAISETQCGGGVTKEELETRTQ